MKVSDGTAKAFKWYRQAADAGVPSAQYTVALCLSEGEGVRLNMRAAARWYAMAAKAGDADAQHNLALLYLAGEGVRKRPTEAFRLFGRAARNGRADSAFDVGLMYDNGVGVRVTRLWPRSGINGQRISEWQQHNVILLSLCSTALGFNRIWRLLGGGLELAAIQGDRLAQRHLADCYEKELAAKSM